MFAVTSSGSSVRPLSPRRVVVLPRDPSHEEIAAIERGRTLLRRRPAPAYPDHGPRWENWRLSSAKIDLIIRVVDHQVRYYDRVDLLAVWLEHVARREELGSTGIGHHIGILDYRLQEPIAVDELPADWWLFLIPEGVDWESLDDEPLHVLFAVQVAEPYQPGRHLRELERITRAARRLPAAGWRAVAQMTPFEAARSVNGLVEMNEEDRARQPS